MGNSEEHLKEEGYRVFSEFSEDPKRSELSIYRSGKVKLAVPGRKNNLFRRLFGGEKLDPTTTLHVLHAVWLHYKTGGKSPETRDRKVQSLAHRIIDQLSPESPRLQGPKGRDLLTAIQSTLVNYVKKHRLPRQVLIVQEAMTHWVQPLHLLHLEEELPLLAHRLVICGIAAVEKFRDLPLAPAEKGELFTSAQLAEVLEVLAHNMGESLDLEEFKAGSEAGKNLCDPECLREVLFQRIQENSQTGRLLKAFSDSMCHIPAHHVKEVLEQVIDLEKVPMSCSCRSSWVIIGVKKIEVTHTIRFGTDPDQVPSEEGFHFDGEFSLSFDRGMRECTEGNFRVLAPEFGLEVRDTFACDVNEALMDHFPFYY